MEQLFMKKYDFNLDYTTILLWSNSRNATSRNSRLIYTFLRLFFFYRIASKFSLPKSVKRVVRVGRTIYFFAMPNLF